MFALLPSFAKACFSPCVNAVPVIIRLAIIPRELSKPGAPTTYEFLYKQINDKYNRYQMVYTYNTVDTNHLWYKIHVLHVVSECCPVRVMQLICWCCRPTHSSYLTICAWALKGCQATSSKCIPYTHTCMLTHVLGHGNILWILSTPHL